MLSKNSFGLPDCTCFNVRCYAFFLYNPPGAFPSKSCFYKPLEKVTFLWEVLLPKHPIKPIC